MCARFTLRTRPEAMIEAAFGSIDIESWGSLEPRVNTAPTHWIPAIVAFDGECWAENLHWGLVPRWATSPAKATSMINARCETAATTPAFRSAYARRRCVIPADGYLEWVRQSDGKQPYWMHRPDHTVFFFAGVWETHPTLNDGRPLNSTAILTRAATESLSAIHDRMPVVLTAETAMSWLTDAANLDRIAETDPSFFCVTPVSRRINSVRHQAPETLQPIAPQPRLFD
ncbi:MAG: SOS response-associated peptidase [Planctomycetota bacterium]